MNLKKRSSEKPIIKIIQLFKVRITFKERCEASLNNVIDVDTNDKDFVIIHQIGNITSFYRRTDIEKLYKEPQEKKQEP